MEEKTSDGKDRFLPVSILLAAAFITGSMVYKAGKADTLRQSESGNNIEKIIPVSDVIPASVTIRVKWGNLGKRMSAAGVIDSAELEKIYAERGGLSPDMKQLLYDENNENLTVTPENANFILNLLWAFGLANENKILTKGPMSDPRYGSPAAFASTGGWTLAVGGAMEHFSRHAFVSLSAKEQALVEDVSKNIYRPCCNNSTYFPDCNHGMAMLGLLELMAAQDLSEAEMYQSALAVNSYWFPDNYSTIARYFETKGIPWSKVNPKEVLGANYSSASGYQRVLRETAPVEKKPGGSCGV